MMTLFAQSYATSGTADRIGPWAVSLSFFVAFVASILVVLAWRNGRLAHEERMRAMEMGVVPPRCISPWATAMYCSAVGLGVPIGTFLLTWQGSQNDNAPTGIWLAPTAVSIVALIGTSIVAAHGLVRSDGSALADKSAATGKPATDHDALDFSGRLRRG